MKTTIKVTGFKRIREMLKETDWSKVAKDAIEKAMREQQAEIQITENERQCPACQSAYNDGYDAGHEVGIWQEINAKAEAKAEVPGRKSRKTRKYWRQKYKKLRKALHATQELLAIRDEQLADEIRGRDADKCKLDEIGDELRIVKRQLEEAKALRGLVVQWVNEYNAIDSYKTIVDMAEMLGLVVVYTNASSGWLKKDDPRNDRPEYYKDARIRRTAADVIRQVRDSE